MFGGKEGSIYKGFVDVTRLEHASEFKYIGCDLDKSGSGSAKSCWKFANMVSAKRLQLECAKVLHEALLLTVSLYGSETMVKRDRERAKFRVLQIDNLRDVLGIRRMNRVPNLRVKWLRGVTKEKGNDGTSLKWNPGEQQQLKNKSAPEEEAKRKRK